MVPNGKIWQITEERKKAVCAMTKMLAAIGCQSCHNYIQKYYSNHIAVLRAMLEEAEQ
jgi:RNA binding exosome subunit